MRYRLRRRWLIATYFVFLTGFSPFVVACVAGELQQSLPASTGDLSTARSAELRDAAGQVVLSGQFVDGSRREDDNERIAALKATWASANGQTENANGRGKGSNGKGRDAAARGRVELETKRALFGFGATTQKLELSVRGLTAGANYTLFIDGKQVASFTTTRRGRAEIAWDGPGSR